MDQCEALKQLGWVGFAHFYLHQCDKESTQDNSIDFQIYKRLVELDSKLSTTASENLYRSLQYPTGSDIFKV